MSPDGRRNLMGLLQLGFSGNLLSKSVTFDGSGVLIVSESKCAGFVEHDIKTTYKGTHENRIQAFCR
jgi:hypothetical protein